MSFPRTLLLWMSALWTLLSLNCPLPIESAAYELLPSARNSATRNMTRAPQIRPSLMR